MIKSHGIFIGVVLVRVIEMCMVHKHVQMMALSSHNNDAFPLPMCVGSMLSYATQLHLSHSPSSMLCLIYKESEREEKERKVKRKRKIKGMMNFYSCFLM